MNTNGKIKFSSIFSKDQILCHTRLTDRDAVIRELLGMLAYQHGIGNVDEAFKNVLDREALLPSILIPGVAMPHARIDAIDELVVAMATSTQGITFNDDGEKVNLVVLILAPKSDPALYLQATSSLAKIFAAPETARQIAQMDSPEEVWRFFDRGGVILPDYVCAGDLMDTRFVSLKENDSLERAIEMFVKFNVLNIPVIDADGDLVGVVSAHELFKVCLPDYILWMEDLSPIINFEPFAEILRKESSTWLTEIMSLDYATIPETAPAVQVAKEITRRATGKVYVVRGTKLVGVISLQEFINKVLWQ